jgi:septal ring factor EnvC (AmiA/AmiB activator)
MNMKYSIFVVAAVTMVSVATPSNCHAQKDPEAAARQAQIDADEARSKIKELRQDQAAAASVQDETTTEMAARDAQIGDTQDDLYDAQRRMREAEREEK